MAILTLPFALVMTATAGLAVAGDGPAVDEYRVKAAFVYNFARFVDWPQSAFRTPQEPIAICILGQNPFGSSLEEAVGGKALGSRTFVIRQIDKLSADSNCHILFVASSECKRFRGMLGKLQPSGVLTVGEAPGFAIEGGVINFKVESGKIRFEVNVDAAQREQLQISSKLLSLAQIVKE
jgi:hypothetical protein